MLHMKRNASTEPNVECTTENGGYDAWYLVAAYIATQRDGPSFNTIVRTVPSLGKCSLASRRKGYAGNGGNDDCSDEKFASARKSQLRRETYIPFVTPSMENNVAPWWEWDDGKHRDSSPAFVRAGPAMDTCWENERQHPVASFMDAITHDASDATTCPLCSESPANDGSVDDATTTNDSIGIIDDEDGAHVDDSESESDASAAIAGNNLFLFLKQQFVVIEHLNGATRYFLNGRLHRVGGPAVVTAYGYVAYYVNGFKHRDDGGPAVTEADGSEHWYRYGELDRADGPAVIVPGRYKKYYRSGVLHRVGGGPTVEQDSLTLF